MRLLIGLLLVSLMLAGCASDDDGDATLPGATPTGPGGNGGGNSGGDQTIVAEPVDISDGGDMTTGVDASWSFDVGTDFTRFDVDVTIDGLNGAEAQLTNCAHAVLSGGTATLYTVEGGGASGSPCTNISLGTPGVCLLCFDGTQDDTVPAGPYRLTLTSEPSPAAYTIRIRTQY